MTRSFFVFCIIGHRNWYYLCILYFIYITFMSESIYIFFFHNLYVIFITKLFSLQTLIYMNLLLPPQYLKIIIFNYYFNRKNNYNE